MKIQIDIYSVINGYLERIAQVTPWDFANEVLYSLCRQHPRHDNEEIILSKTLIIGRVYAAALERNAIKNNDTKFNNTSVEEDCPISDDFYLQKVVPMFRSFFVDSCTC